MIPEATRLAYLFNRYVEKIATEEECAELSALVKSDEYDKYLPNLLQNVYDNTITTDNIISDERAVEILNTILQQKKKPLRKLFWLKFTAVAAMLVLISATWFFVSKHFNKPEQTVKNIQSTDILPGTYKAKLILSNGETILLDSAGNGFLTKQGKVDLLVKDGQLNYAAVGARGEDTMYNVVATGKGETYTMFLSDGTQVYLNAFSSIRFPVNFSKNERRVSITGEAYFKVAKNKELPFIANSSGMDVQALGTEFNINAYADEAALSTTLIEGGVKVSKGTSSVVLNPAQQARFTGNNLQVMDEVNTEEITAWTTGFFHFESADLQTILRQLARWYDVELVNTAAVGNKKYLTIINRNTTLMNALKMLQAADLKFKIEGKKLYVEGK